MRFIYCLLFICAVASCEKNYVVDYYEIKRIQKCDPDNSYRPSKPVEHTQRVKAKSDRKAFIGALYYNLAYTATVGKECSEFKLFRGERQIDIDLSRHTIDSLINVLQIDGNNIPQATILKMQKKYYRLSE